MNTAGAPVPGGAAAPAPYRIHRYPSALIDRVQLADGRTVTLRPVLPQDAQAEGRFVSALSPRSRHSRFHGTVKDLPLRLLDAMTSVDYRSHLALVAEAQPADDRFGNDADFGDDEPRLVADARYVVDADDDAVAEFAVAVADDWQGRGLGRVLLERLARHARRAGLRRIEGAVLADNEPMLALARKLGATLHRVAGDASTLRVRLTL